MRRSHRPTRLAAAALLLVSLVTSACGGDREDALAPSASPSLDGRWAGSAVFGQVRFDATFDQNGRDVTGSGDFTSPLGSGPFDITGTVVGSVVELTLVSSEFGTSTYRGEFTSANRITGTLDAPSYSGLELALERQ